MDKSEWREGVLDLYEYYRFTKPPTTKSIMSMYPYVDNVPQDKFLTAINRIKTEHETLPRNLPKTIKEIYRSLPGVQSKPNKDQFPIEHLQKALEILQAKGYDDFRRYVNGVEMPVEDIERVLNKNLFQTNPAFKKKILSICKNIKEKKGIDFETFI
jgi:hypothetical protein